MKKATIFSQLPSLAFAGFGVIALFNILSLFMELPDLVSYIMVIGGTILLVIGAILGISAGIKDKRTKSNVQE